jgi:hypothetical protein
MTGFEPTILHSSDTGSYLDRLGQATFDLSRRQVDPHKRRSSPFGPITSTFSHTANCLGMYSIEDYRATTNRSLDCTHLLGLTVS